MDTATRPLARPAFASQRSWHPAGRFVDLPGHAGRVHVVSLGRGPDLVLLHGFIQSSWTWRANLEALAAHHTVHAVCLPGFGWSDKPAQATYRLAAQADRVVALLDRLGVDRSHLVGNSLGGALALQVAAQAPARVDRLVLVNPAGTGPSAATLAARVPHEAAAPLLHLPGVPTVLRLALQHGAYANLPVDETLLQSFVQPLRSPGGGRAALQAARYLNRDLAALDARLSDVRRPVLLLWGRGDRLVPLATVERLRRRLVDARLELFDCSGHCPMEEEPVRFNREVLAFLGRAPGAAAG